MTSVKSTDGFMNDGEGQSIKQGWSNVASLHCVLLPELISSIDSYASPRIDLLARRYQACRGDAASKFTVGA